MAGLYDSLMNVSPSPSPSDAPAPYQGTMPAGPGYVTSLQGNPNGPPVNYRNPDQAPQPVQPQQNPMNGLPPALQHWLQSEAARTLEMQLRQQANRKAMGLE